MTNSTKRIISLVLFCVLFLASLSGGIYANVLASQQNTLYKEQATYAEKYEKRYEIASNSDSPLIGSQYFKDFFKEKAVEAKTNADIYKKTMTKYFIFAAVLIFVALAMLACSIITALPLFKNKKQKVDTADEDDEQKPEKTERRKSDFDVVLEAPKPHINSEE